MPLEPTEIHLKRPIPEAVEPFAEFALQPAAAFILNGRIRDLALLTFRDEEAKLWELTDAQSGAVADALIRSIAEREGAPAIAVVRSVSSPPETSVSPPLETPCYGAFNLAVECAAGKQDQLVGLQSRPNGDQLVIFKRDDPKYRWSRTITRGRSTSRDGVPRGEA